MTAYQDLSSAEQEQALLPVARAAAEQFGLPVAGLEPHTHAYNTTFALRTDDGEQFALRVNTNSTSSPAQVLAQQAWQVALAQETEVLVPEPRRTTDGAWYATVPAPVSPLGRDAVVTCASWLPGPDVGEPDEAVGREMGRTLALLHEHATGWTLPEGGEMPLHDSPYLGLEPTMASAPGLDAEQREVLRVAEERCLAAFARAHAAAPTIALHADLHGANLKWHEGRLAVFDFDDCGIGVPALDLTIAAFYLRGGPELERAEAAMLAGYAELRPLPDLDPADLEAMVASRQLLLAADLLSSSTAELRERAQTYLGASVDRLRHWLSTGHFTRVLPTS